MRTGDHRYLEEKPGTRPEEWQSGMELLEKVIVVMSLIILGFIGLVVFGVYLLVW